MFTGFVLGTNDGEQLKRACTTSSVMSGGVAPNLAMRMGTLPACSLNVMFLSLVRLAVRL